MADQFDHDTNKPEDNPLAEALRTFQDYLFALKPDGTPALDIPIEEKAARLDKFRSYLRNK